MFTAAMSINIYIIAQYTLFMKERDILTEFMIQTLLIASNK